MRRVNAVSSLVLAVVALYYLFETSRLPLWKGLTPASGYFPLILGCALAAVSVVSLVKAVAVRGDVEQDVGELVPKGEGLRNLLIVVGLLFLYCLSFQVIGFLLSTCIFLSLLLIGLESASRKSAVAVGAAVAAASYLVFVMLLQVQLPRGLLG